MHIRVSLPLQTLELFSARGDRLAGYAVSTAKNGAGEVRGSYCTPRGRHVIRAKVGAGAAPNTVFVRRRPTGEVWSPELDAQFPGRDWILTRILWLSGCEVGKNRLGEVDTMRRFIYIHGSPARVAMGAPGSIGCIRMRNEDIIELFDRVAVGTSVTIVEYGLTTGDWGALGESVRPLREAVFIGEQGVPAALEWDQFDAVSRHVLARTASGEVVGCGRLLPDGHLGRLAVRADWRGQGVGRALVEALLSEASRHGLEETLLHAQVQVLGFYERLGFEVEGEAFLEAGIWHRLMRRRTKSASDNGSVGLDERQEARSAHRSLSSHPDGG